MIYRYALLLRPFGFTHQPDGWVGRADNPEFPHGEVHYSRPLTSDEIESYSLLDLDSPLPCAPGDTVVSGEYAYRILSVDRRHGCRIVAEVDFGEPDQARWEYQVTWADYEREYKFEVRK